MTIDVKLLRGLFEHERLKPVMLRTDKDNVNTLISIKMSNEFRNLCLTYLIHPYHREVNCMMNGDHIQPN